MIAVIGGVKTTVQIKMSPPERDIEKQRKLDEEALLAAGIDINRDKDDGAEGESPEDARFRQYYESKMREQAGENYWSEVGLGGGDFGGYATVAAGEDARITTENSGCSFTVAKAMAAGTDVCFLSVVGDDALGLAAKCRLEQAGADISAVETVPGDTPVSVEIHNMMGDLQFWRENTHLTDMITPGYLERHDDILQKAEAIFTDGSLPVETLNYISAKYGRVYFAPGSMDGAVAFANSQLKPYCVIPTRMEAEAMAGMQVIGMDQLVAAAESFEKRGVEKTVITLKTGGVFYKCGEEARIFRPEEIPEFDAVISAAIDWKER